MDAYRETVGPTREFARSMHGTQQGDPRKAAAAIEQAIDAPDTQLRLQLGGDAVTAIRGHAEQLLAELDKWEIIGSATAFEGA